MPPGWYIWVNWPGFWNGPFPTEKEAKDYRVACLWQPRPNPIRYVAEPTF